MHLISYVEFETGAHFLPPTSWVDGEFTWLCALDGRHYARIASLDYGDQDAGIDIQTHDLAVETDLAVRLDALAVDRAEARSLRAERYAREMPVGDQLDAVLKTLDSLREGGAELPAETEALIERWLAIKTDGRRRPQPVPSLSCCPRRR